jgi:serine/threonine protein kinase
MAQRIAIVVGINSYSLPIADLKYACADAEAINECLSTAPYDFHVAQLLDSNATRRQILRELAQVRQSEADLVVFFFAGHGVTTSTGTYLLPSDAEFLEDGIEVGTLARALDAQKATKTLAILDCCHGGGAAPRGLGARSMTNEDFSRAITSFSRTRAFMAACLPEESSWEDPEVGHGIFTSYVLEALSGRAADSDGKITVAGIYQYVSKPFQSDTRQTPVLRGDLYGDLIMAEGFASAGPDVGDSDSIITEMIDKGRTLLDAYITTPGQTRAGYREFGYRDRCRQLEPVVLWFDKQLARHKTVLEGNSEFMDLHNSAWAEAGHLGHLSPGLKLERGEVDSMLGEGTFGSVWKVNVEENFQAYKVYHPSELRNHEKLTRFHQGYEAMRRLSHPRIVQVSAFTPCPLGFYMNFVDGPNLREAGPPSNDPTETLALLLEVAEAIRHAHGLGVIHRDIKPENIIMKYSVSSGKYVPYVTDFDLAWFSTATQLTNQAIGALSYAAPEQLTPRLADAARQPTVDIYAFGQLAYFCVVDAPPIPMDYGANERRLQDALRSRWTDVQAIDAFSQFYQRCNRSDPAERYQTVQECIDVLSNIAQLMQSVRSNEKITAMRLMEGIAYALSGQVGPVISSSSGRTELVFILKEQRKESADSINLEVRFRPLQEFGYSGKSMAARRTEVNRQIDAALRGFPRVTRRSGHDPGFEIFIEMNRIELRHHSINECRGILDRVIDVMER